MRVTIINATGKVLEAQSGNGSTQADLQPLYDNATAAGYDFADISVQVMSDAAFYEMMTDDLEANPIVPISVSIRQFYQQAANSALITEEEALAMIEGTIPADLETVIAALPSEEQFAVRMLIEGASVYERYHPVFVNIMTDAFGWTSEQMDDFFIAAAQL